MTGMELVRSRRSVRTFDGHHLKSEDAKKLMDYAYNTTNPYNLSIDWRLLSAKVSGLSSPVIAGTDSWIAGKMKRAPHAEEAFGYTFEKIVLYAEFLGFGTTWIAGTMDRPAFERAMELKADEVMPCVSPLGYPAEKKSLREVMMRKGIKADSRMKFEDLFYSGSFENPMRVENAGNLADPLEMVRWAPSAVNKQPWRIIVDGDTIHFYEKRSRGYVSADGWDLQKIDLGIAMCHFALGLSDQGRNLKLRIDDPGLSNDANVFYIASYDLEK